MVRGLTELIKLVAFFVPLRVLIVLIGFGLIAAAPVWFETVRDKQIRGTIRRMVRADEVEKVELAREALRLAAGRPRRLGTLVRQAIQYDQGRLREEGIAALEAVGAATEVKHLRALLTPTSHRFRDPLEAVIRVERMLKQDLLLVAREHLNAARQAFPEDSDLLALDESLKEAERKGTARKESEAREPESKEPESKRAGLQEEDPA